MWNITQHGFTSTVAYDPKQDRNPRSEFRNIARQAGTHLLVRARLEADLYPLKQVCPNLHIEVDPQADYSFRCVVSREQMKRYMCLEVDQIDYDSHFKEAFRDSAPQGTARYPALMSIWSAMAKFQPYSPYGTGFGKKVELQDSEAKNTGFQGASQGSQSSLWGGHDAESDDGLGWWLEAGAGNSALPKEEPPIDLVTSVWDELDQAYGLAVNDGVSDEAIGGIDLWENHAKTFFERLRKMELTGPVAQTTANEVYDEIMWEAMPLQERIDWAKGGADVPPKYEAEAANLASS
jgi:hypothetical protein